MDNQGPNNYNNGNNNYNNMIEKIKAATSTVTELVNATEIASIEQSNTNNMEKQGQP